jgi:hypothetical protein
MRYEVRGMGCEVRGARYEVRGTWYEVWGTWYEVHLLGVRPRVWQCGTGC